MKLALVLILLHSVDGHEVRVNPIEVTSLRDAAAASDGLMHEKVKCIVATADGKYVSVIEPCSEVQQLLEGFKR